MNMPLVSIIVPIYKVEKYLDRCVCSIINQTYSNIEIWLVDDGSPDACGEMCDDYARKDERVRVIHKQNGGLSDARNVAIDVALGEWITCIDSDDFVAPNYVEFLLNIVMQNDSMCGVVQPQEFFEGQSPRQESQDDDLVVLSGKDAISAMFYQTLFDTSAWGKLYHKSLFQTGIRYPKGLLFEDNPTTYLLLSRCRSVVVSQAKLYYYLVRKDSIQGADFTPPKLDQALQILNLMQQHPEITNEIPCAYRCKMASLAFHFLMKMPMDYDKKDELADYVKKNRLRVFFDGKARLKTRLACLLSYMGMPVTKMIFKLIGKR